MDVTATALLLAWVAIVLLAFGLAGILRQLAQLQPSATSPAAIGPSVGQTAGPTLPDGTRWMDPTLILFLDTDCDACAALLSHISDVAVRTTTAIATLYRSSVDGIQPPNHAFRVLENQAGYFARLGISATPFAVGVSADGVVLLAEPVGSPGALDTVMDALEHERAK